MIYPLIRPLLFASDPENGHEQVMKLLTIMSRKESLTCALEHTFKKQVQALPHEVMGIHFPNPVGVAAGLDKQGSAACALSALGFGWVESGTVTPEPQVGNPKPRLFRLPEYKAIINRMGFNSCGLDEFNNNLAQLVKRPIHGINIGKNAVTSLDNAVDDYLAGLRAVAQYADYVCVNISSPNTRDLRNLQESNRLSQLLGALDEERRKLSDRFGKAIPLAVKIAPDLDSDQIKHIADTLVGSNMNAVVATNTTNSRTGVESHRYGNEAGGLSGKPLDDLSTRIIAEFYQHLQGELPIIGVGGIYSAESAWRKIQAGADLLQIYTGFIYQGPALIREIVCDLIARCNGNDFKSVIIAARKHDAIKTNQAV